MTSADQQFIEATWEAFEQFSPANQSVQERLKNLKTDDFDRTLSYGARRAVQIPLPPFPTTTIGSFPQTSEVRQLRMRYKRGELSQADYQTAIEAHIADSIKLQEEIGLDVLEITEAGYSHQVGNGIYERQTRN